MRLRVCLWASETFLQIIQFQLEYFSDDARQTQSTLVHRLNVAHTAEVIEISRQAPQLTFSISRVVASVGFGNAKQL